MPNSIGDLVLITLAAGLTPTAVLAAILLLLSERPRRNGVAYLTGWFLGLLVLSWILVGILFSLGLFSRVPSQVSFSNGARLVLGALLILVAVVAWRRRPRPGESGSTPAWFNRLEGIRPHLAFGIGAGLAAASPKILLLTAAIAVHIQEASLGAGAAIGVDLFYAIVASVPVAIPVALVFARKDRARGRLSRWREWLLVNGQAITAIVSLGIGLLLIGRAAASLLA
jgi:hypothetical protein